MDTDLGQCEFCPAGAVSVFILDEPLLGPAFTHPKSPYKSVFMGALSPRDAPQTYLNAIRELVRIAKQDIPIQLTGFHHSKNTRERRGDSNRGMGVPVVVNLHGWVNGMGYDLLLQILDMTEPSMVYSLPLFEQGVLSWVTLDETRHNVAKLDGWMTRGEEQKGRNVMGTVAVSNRQRMLLSWLLVQRGSIASGLNETGKEDVEVYVGWRREAGWTESPYRVPFREVEVYFSMGEDMIVDAKEMYYALNGTVVALLARTHHSTTTIQREDHPKETERNQSNIVRFSSFPTPFLTGDVEVCTRKRDVRSRNAYLCWHWPDTHGRRETW